MPNTDFKILIVCRLFRPILLRMTTTMRGMDPTGPPECRPVECSKNWGCSLETNLLRVVTTSGWIASRDLFECRLTQWSTIKSGVAQGAHLEWLQSEGWSTTLEWLHRLRFCRLYGQSKINNGYCFKFGNRAISWMSKLQECTTT